MSQRHCAYGTDLRRQTEVPRGFVGDQPRVQEFSVVGEDNSLYAIHTGTLHDPRLIRPCSARIGKLCGEEWGTENQRCFSRPGGPTDELRTVYANPWPASYSYGDKIRSDMIYGTGATYCGCEGKEGYCGTMPKGGCLSCSGK